VRWRWSQDAGEEHQDDQAAKGNFDQKGKFEGDLAIYPAIFGVTGNMGS